MSRIVALPTPILERDESHHRPSHGSSGEAEEQSQRVSHDLKSVFWLHVAHAAVVLAGLPSNNFWPRSADDRRFFVPKASN
jgi:hypothetical protein